MLELLISDASDLIFSSHVLAEVSNLIRQFSDPGRSKVVGVFRDLVESFSERHVEGARAVKHHEFPRLGLTDAALLLVENSAAMLLTDDLDLYLASVSVGRPAINFSHERARWFDL